MSHEQDHPFRERFSSEWVLYAGLLCVVAAGVVMRLFALGDHPYGLYQDEAVNGLDALRVLGGEHPLYFAANNGREPLFIYLMAGTVGLFGRTPLGVRAAAAILGILTLPAVYLLGVAWGNRRVGALSASILAAMLWHVHLSRVGFRAVALPLCIALALGLGALGLRFRSRWVVIGAGVVCGLSFYTYTPARFTPLALVAMLAYGLIWHREWLRERWQLLVWGSIAMLLTVIPLVVVAFRQPDVVLGRSGQVAIWSAVVHHGDPVGTALRSGLRTLGMFTWQGDWIWRHNVPHRPVFDPFLSVAFIAGVVMAIIRWRSRPALALSLIWVGVMVLPTLLAADAPHFLRAVGVLPVVVLLPALALDTGLGWAASPRVPLFPALFPSPYAGRKERTAYGVRRGGIIPAALILAVLSVGAALTARDYFGCRGTALRLSGFDYAGCYRTDPVRGYFFQAEATTLAVEANTSPGTLYLARRLWDTFPSLQFLVPEDDRLVLYPQGETLQPDVLPLTVIAWPHADLAPVLNVIPPDAQIGVWPGPETRGDQEESVYRLYVRWVAEPPGVEPVPPLARFDNGITLVDVQVERTGDLLHVVLRWKLEQVQDRPVQMFFHVIGEGGAKLAQLDEPPGTIYYPPLSWRLGSVIIHPITLAVTWPEGVPARLLIGLYDPASGDRLPILEACVEVQDRALHLPLSGEYELIDEERVP